MNLFFFLRQAKRDATMSHSEAGLIPDLQLREQNQSRKKEIARQGTRKAQRMSWPSARSKKSRASNNCSHLVSLSCIPKIMWKKSPTFNQPTICRILCAGVRFYLECAQPLKTCRHEAKNLLPGGTPPESWSNRRCFIPNSPGASDPGPWRKLKSFLGVPFKCPCVLGGYRRTRHGAMGMPCMVITHTRACCIRKVSCGWRELCCLVCDLKNTYVPWFSLCSQKQQEPVLFVAFQSERTG